MFFMGINYFEKYINYILYIFYVETLLMTLQTEQIRLRQRGLSSAVRSIVSSLRLYNIVQAIFFLCTFNCISQHHTPTCNFTVILTITLIVPCYDLDVLLTGSECM